MHVLTCTLLVVIATVCDAALIGLSQGDRRQILIAHNRLRSRTALGRTPGQPSAANMAALQWDPRLERSAARWVGQCVQGHDNPTLPGFNWVGQNWAGGYSKQYNTYVQLWFDEYKQYTYNTKRCSGVCGHYTQVVWAKTTLVGCAAASCSRFPVHFVCNYATAGNFNGEFPYVRGAAASRCPGSHRVRRNDGLCHRR